ncbi:MAG TPA: redoxin domain-containing protein [Tepidisphaeraceae bacterium]|nr:redoxin domain-containing protein [Tepidisphaeraceae bacterium]
MSDILPPGTPAPDFELPAGPDAKVSLRQFRGRPVVLVFYPADFSPVCGDQLALYNEVLPELEETAAQVLGISVDGVWCHRAYGESRKLRFPLLSDFEPKGAVAQKYGAYEPEWGVSSRSLFVIDGDGVIRWSYKSPADVNPGADGILAALDRLVAGAPAAGAAATGAAATGTTSPAGEGGAAR